jgi:hypothetical protein
VSRVPPRLRRLSHAVAALLACAVAVGCGAPPDLGSARGTNVPTPGLTPSGSPSPTGTPVLPTAPTGLPTPPPSPTGFPETYAVACEGKPTGTQVIRAVRRQAGLLPASARATVDTGPLCSGTWQYTVVVVAGREPLAVVTRGRPGSLRLVTAGTNVCSIPVRTEAPIGIRTAAAC